MEYSDYFLSPKDDDTIERKIEIIKANITTAKIMLDKIKVSKKPVVSEQTEVVFKEENTRCDAKEDQKMLSIVGKITSLNIEGMSDDEATQEILKIVNEEYFGFSEKLANQIKIGIYKEIVEYRNMLMGEDALEIKEDVKVILRELRRKIYLIGEALEEKELLETAENDNKLYFLVSDAGNIYFLENIRKNAPKEYYQLFLDLLMDIKKGAFPGLKRMTRLGYFEVRLNDIRITFDRISKDSYVIIDGFTKKEDTSSLYKSTMENRASQYAGMRNIYINSLSKADFRELHFRYFNDIVGFLESKGNNLGERL